MQLFARYQTTISCFLLLFFLFPSLTLAEELEWQQKTDLPIGLTGSASAEVDGKIYIFGGGTSGVAMSATKTNKTYMYDPSNDTWSEKKSMPTARAAATAAVYEGKIYVIGGYYDKNKILTRTNVTEVYDPQTDTWETKQPLQTARSWAGSTVVNGKIYVFGGGYDNSKPSMNSVESYDPLNNQWTYKNNMPIGTNGPSVAQVNGKVYITGGTTTPYNTTIYHTALYEYDTLTDTYLEKASSSIQRAASSTVVVNGEIYYLGSGLPVGGTSTVEKYNPLTDSWISVTNLTFWRYQSAAALVGNNIFIIGGVTNDSTKGSLKTVEMYTLPAPQEPEQPSGNRAILVVTMNTGLEKEYDLSMDEVNAFINWYDTKDAGSGPSKYAINKHDNNRGPFSKRTDYVIFNNILTFGISEYSTFTNDAD